MARRTKVQAEQTRSRIIDAARRSFARRGVGQTTMEHIAQEAGVTRGAIYWHFTNKTELFFAMRDQVRLPLLDRMNTVLHGDDDPLDAVERFLLQILEGVAQDPRTRETYAIMHFKCEYVSDLEAVLTQMMKGCRDMLDHIESAYRRAAVLGRLRAGMDPRLAALETFAFVSGLVRMWLSDVRGRVVRKQIGELIAAHVATRRRESELPKPA